MAVKRSQVQKESSNKRTKASNKSHSGIPSEYQIVASDEERNDLLKRAESFGRDAESRHPVFVKSMTRSHVYEGFWLGLPRDFCKEHLPSQDLMMELVDEQGVKAEAKYLSNKGGLSGGWRGFSLSHRLLDGDAVVFMLVEKAKFQVHIFRVRPSFARDWVISDKKSSVKSFGGFESNDKLGDYDEVGASNEAAEIVMTSCKRIKRKASTEKKEVAAASRKQDTFRENGVTSSSKEEPSKQTEERTSIAKDCDEVGAASKKPSCKRAQPVHTVGKINKRSTRKASYEKKEVAASKKQEAPKMKEETSKSKEGTSEQSEERTSITEEDASKQKEVISGTLQASKQKKQVKLKAKRALKLFRRKKFPNRRFSKLRI